MKVAIISPYDFAFPSGVNNNAIHTAACFREWGHEVTIIGPCSDDQAALPTHFIPAVGSVVSFPFAGTMARVNLSPRAYRQAKRLLQQRFDVIHIHEPMTPALPLALLRHAPLSPQSLLVGTFHASREVSASYTYGKPILKRFFKRLEGRIAVSPAARDYIASFFGGDYAIIPNGIDAKRFAERVPMPGYQDGKLNILFVGRLEKRKGFRFLLGAFKRVQAAMPQTRLIVAGAYDDSDKQPFVQYVQDNRLADVCFVGRISEEDKPRYYQSCHVFCAPSTGSESFGLVLLEAMAAGKPTVACDILGYRTVVTHGQEGLLVSPENEEALADALLYLVRDAEVRKAMGQRGQAKAQAYAWEHVSGHVMCYYRELMAERGQLRHTARLGNEPHTAQQSAGEEKAQSDA